MYDDDDADAFDYDGDDNYDFEQECPAISDANTSIENEPTEAPQTTGNS
jgi:hypothetical protein